MRKPFQRIPRNDYEQKLIDMAAELLPACARTPTLSLESAIIVKEGHGSKITDMSGNEYVDYLLGSGPIFLGHAHPAVVKAVSAALENGSSFLLPNEPSILLAEELVKAVPCAEKICLGNTGSDATFFAMRLARAFRKRDKILKFEGGYHGQGDHALMSNQWTKEPKAYPTPVPNSEGIPKSAVKDVLIAPFNDLDITADIIEKNRDDIAGVIVEPMQRTIPPQPGFLEGLREITARHEIPLIFDEVVTGFRLAYGGAQEYYGVTPDLCAIGKSMSAGHPISAVCGRTDIMEFAEGIRRITGNYVSLTGTYSGNPISCIAALATLKELRREGVYESVFAKGTRLKNALQKSLDDAGIPAQVLGEPPAFQPWFSETRISDFRSSQSSDAMLSFQLLQELIDRGVLKGHEKFFISTVHSDEDIDFTIDVIDDAVQAMKS